ncbi:LVIVD repeat-containing protein [Tellurirhabdus bombi]|uniref:LVIVD repeat-containing protein n=1 Tax=Tellurirhabdus bombi TaxID=2907205 RepID=UPI001F46B560|nr:hypothetical protein [Tellurirhabdus bombi]
MKLKLLPLLTLLVCLALACTDNCRETRTFRRFTAQTFTAAQIREGVQQEDARALQMPGKIYTKDGYLFINELKEGIHVIDNRNPENPRTLTFLRIPGNGDMAVRNNILYADSYMDLLAFDISNPASIKPVNRVQNVFPNGVFDGASWSFDANSNRINDQRVDYVTETIATNCDNAQPANNGWWWGGTLLSDSRAFNSASPAPNSSGVGGSMARFALYDNYLYTVSQSNMQLFDIRNAANPVIGNKITLGWGIETVFPYKDKLFIGSQTGMQILDNSNPEKPVHMSTFQHARVCDPVVVNDNIAYVTLRSGNTCAGFQNQLDVVDISNLYSPRLLKSYPMKNPHGLGVNFPNLFICEGHYGLKSLDVSNTMDVKQLMHLEGMDAFDVIPLGKTLMMIGRDGLYQFDASNPSKLRQISKIPVTRPWQNI